MIFASIDPVMVEIGPVRLWYYGLAYAIGLLSVDLWVYLKRESLGYSRRDVAWFSLLFTVGVLLGGRFFDVGLYEWFYYEEHPWQILRLWEGGMASHGVLLGAVVGTLIFCRLQRKSFLAIVDEVVIPGTVLMALGRVGNHINGEVYGSVSSVAWAMEFAYAEGCRHPVALYDGIKNLLILPILLGVRNVSLRQNGYLPRGLMLGHFVLWYGLLRLFVDYFRDYDSYWFGVGRGQYFNLLMALIGLCILAVVRRRADVKRTVVRRSRRPKERAAWAPRVVVYALVALCLTIPSGWTQQVLDDFETRAGEATPAVSSCGGRRAGARRGGVPTAS